MQRKSSKKNAIKVDKKAMGVRDWKQTCKDMNEWKKLTESIKTHNTL